MSEYLRELHNMSDLVIWVAIGVLLSHQTINPLIADVDGRGRTCECRTTTYKTALRDLPSRGQGSQVYKELNMWQNRAYRAPGAPSERPHGREDTFVFGPF